MEAGTSLWHPRKINHPHTQDLWEVHLLTKAMRVNTRNTDKIKLDGEAIDEAEELTYLGSNISKDGESIRYIQARNGEARTAFTILTPVWRSKVTSRKTKLRIKSYSTLT